MEFLTKRPDIKTKDNKNLFNDKLALTLKWRNQLGIYRVFFKINFLGVFLCEKSFTSIKKSERPVWPLNKRFYVLHLLHVRFFQNSTRNHEQ